MSVYDALFASGAKCIVARRLVCNTGLLMGLQSVTTVHRAAGHGAQLTVFSLTTRLTYVLHDGMIRLFDVR